MFKKIAGVLVAVAPMASFAAVDAAITTAITTVGADGLVVAGGITVVMAGLWAAMLIKRKFFG